MTKLAAILDQIEFYVPAKVRDDPRSVDVTSLYSRGLEPHLAALTPTRALSRGSSPTYSG